MRIDIFLCCFEFLYVCFDGVFSLCLGACDDLLLWTQHFSSIALVESNDHCDCMCDLQEGGVRALRFKHRAGAFPTVSDFFVLVYNDPFLTSLAEVWQVIVHARLK